MIGLLAGYPLVTNILTGVFVYGWIMSTINLYSVGSISASDGSLVSNIQTVTDAKRLSFFNLIVLIWIISFIRYHGNFVIFIRFIYDKAREDGSSLPMSIISGYWWAFRYYIGSIALGSFILPFMWIIRIPLKYISKELEDDDNKDNNIFIKCCFDYIKSTLDKAILSSDIHVVCEIAFSGESYCKALKESLTNPDTIREDSNQDKYRIFNHFMTIAKLFIVGFTLCIAMIIIRYKDYINENLTSPFWPLFVNQL